jgi:hypothetical protein
MLDLEDRLDELGLHRRMRAGPQGPHVVLARAGLRPGAGVPVAPAA